MILFFILIVAVGLTLFLYGWFIEPRWMMHPVDRVTIEGKQFAHPVRFLFISDIHLGKNTQLVATMERLSLLRQEHAVLPYSAIFIGGDWIDTDPKYLPLLEEFAHALLTFDVPVYAVLGNHDHQEWEGEREVIVESLNRAGICLLENAWALHRDPISGVEVQIIGSMDIKLDPLYKTGQIDDLTDYAHRVKKMTYLEGLSGLDPKKATLFLVHNPDGIYLPLPVEPDLTLSGHTHGGQFIFFEWIMDRLGLWPYFVNHLPPGSFLSWAGRGVFNNRLLLVSRGFGSAQWPLRILKWPQAHTIILTPPSQKLSALLIGISGKARSGKDTLANFILEKIPSLGRAAFAAQIKKEYDLQHGTNTLGDEKEKIRHREGLIQLGLELTRDDPNHIIDKTLAISRPLLITDVRLIAEADAIRAQGGLLIRVNASYETLAHRSGPAYETIRHTRNEVQLDSYDHWDYVLSNDSSLEEFEAQANAVIASITEQYQ
jgi:predicted MPP superfamily phosphohydrolase